MIPPLDCAPTPSTLAQSKEREGSNFAIWQLCYKTAWMEPHVKEEPSAAATVGKTGEVDEEEDDSVFKKRKGSASDDVKVPKSLD